MNIENIHILRLAAAYVLLIFPLAVILWYRLGIAGRMMLAVVRMTVQLLFVGFYLQVLFEVNSPSSLASRSKSSIRPISGPLAKPISRSASPVSAGRTCLSFVK